MKMGWSNYIVVPKWEVKFEIPRDVQMDSFMLDEFDKIENITKYMYAEEFETKLMDMDIIEMSKMFLIADNAYNIFQDDCWEIYAFIRVLKKLEVKFYIFEGCGEMEEKVGWYKTIPLF